MSKSTLTELEKRWKTFKLKEYAFKDIRSTGAQKVETSRSGEGMIFLKGIQIQVMIDKKMEWRDAHLAFPPDETGSGTFTEGHLKFESKPLLNQYFFSCSDNDNWGVEKLTNSPTIKTGEPGNWGDLGDNLWKEIQELVVDLAYHPTMPEI